jgi:hypothetical protein
MLFRKSSSAPFRKQSSAMYFVLLLSLFEGRGGGDLCLKWQKEQRSPFLQPTVFST